MTAANWMKTCGLVGILVPVSWLLAAIVFRVRWGRLTIYTWPSSLLTLANSGDLLTSRTIVTDLLAIALNVVLYVAIGGLILVANTQVRRLWFALHG